MQNFEEDKLDIEKALDVLSNQESTSFVDYYETSLNNYDTFDKKAYETGHGYSSIDFPFIDEKLEGLLPGLYLFAARANCGKTALMTNLAWSYCKNPDNHLFCVYYSIDDNCNEVIPRLISMIEEIPISICDKPKRYIDELEILKQNESENLSKIAQYEDWLSKRELGLEMLKNNKDKFLIIDTDTVQSFEQLMDHAKKVQTFVKEKDPNNDIMVCIDAVSDLSFSTKNFRSSDEMNRELSIQLKNFANELKVPVFGSCHLKKQDSRPVLNDLRDTGRFQYDASAIFLLYNDVSENKQNASIYYGESPDVEPIIEINWAKNKKSSFKGNSFCYFIPEYSKVIECAENEMNRYKTLLYTN